MTDHIHFIITGGTIDSEYHPPLETTVPHKNSVIPEYILMKIKPYMDVTFDNIFMLDSSDLDDTHRAQIVAAIDATKAKKIIVCHGTNTMAQSADYIAARIKDKTKTVVLTGAMIPLKEFAMSDAGFNLGFAVAEVQRLGVGVYVCMNATSFAAGDVRKNVKLGRFEPSASEGRSKAAG